MQKCSTEMYFIDFNLYFLGEEVKGGTLHKKQKDFEVEKYKKRGKYFDY